jgi:hypothetical protein
MERLQHDRRPGLERGEDAADVGRPGEGRRAPGQVGRVVAEVELRAGLDEAEGWEADARRADEPLDVGDRE